jgi:hypothetical protein
VNRVLAVISISAIGAAWVLGRRKKRTDVPREVPHEVIAHNDVARDEVDALARVITSEADHYSEAERTAVAWAVRNRARKRRKPVDRVVCWPACGACCEGRPFSSARPATAANRELAARVLAAPQSEDPTGGATSFFEPRVQDWLVAAGRKGYRFTSVKLRKRWQDKGQTMRGTVGAFELWA